MFTTSVRKYTRARKLTPRMLNEMIERIEVHQSEKIDGKTVQQLTIHYNCIGNIEIPDLEKLPENNVSAHTRQGVDVHFAYVASKKSNKKPRVIQNLSSSVRTLSMVRVFLQDLTENAVKLNFKCRRHSRKRLVVSQRRYECACKRIDDANVTFCE